MNINEIKAKIASVVNALNSIEVKGRENLVNLSGSIAVLEDVYGMIVPDVQSKPSSKS